ncbi:helix-turn-helix domain-containing protein [Acetobacterium wieringae]|uniref:Helix-turn-helix domain-containing protein n=1 Tax=Acetobacterium wieringae TaxID=52694 RepID=A0ABY6HEQ9_9FIRM|nr:helix-turn-helix transcriptional regulator [Acetobacterium wieringae]UYO62965.1 helix-turn-helix domain-containing protein [Acetobacterium wieringae]VUZ26887.1 Uncharacterised protein [Acetobacterium wieringae]
MEFKDQLKKYRKEKEKTQQEFANKTGISLGSIRQYERGERTPKVDTLKKIVDAFGDPLSKLVSNDSPFWWERDLEKLENADKSFLNILDKLGIDDRVYLLSRLTTALDYCLRSYSDEQKSKNIRNIADFIGDFGDLIMDSFGMRFSSEENPRDYYKFLDRYHKLNIALGQQKEDLIKDVLSVAEDGSDGWEKGNSKLRHLIYDEIY